MQVDRKSMEHTVPFIFQWDETFDVGMDTGTGVAAVEFRYAPPFAFTGKIGKLNIKVNRPQLSPADIKRLEQGSQQKGARD